MKKYITKRFHYKNDLDEIDKFLNEQINDFPDSDYKRTVVGYVSCDDYIIITVEFFIASFRAKDATYFKNKK